MRGRTQKLRAPRNKNAFPRIFGSFFNNWKFFQCYLTLLFLELKVSLAIDEHICYKASVRCCGQVTFFSHKLDCYVRCKRLKSLSVAFGNLCCFAINSVKNRPCLRASKTNKVQQQFGQMQYFTWLLSLVFFNWSLYFQSVPIFTHKNFRTVYHSKRSVIFTQTLLLLSLKLGRIHFNP